MINTVSIYLYLHKKLLLLTALIFAYMLLAIWGDVTWLKQHQHQKE